MYFKICFKIQYKTVYKIFRIPKFRIHDLLLQLRLQTNSVTFPTQLPFDDGSFYMTKSISVINLI